MSRIGLNDVIGQAEAARILGVSTVTILNMVARGELRRVRTPLGWAYSHRQTSALAAERAERYHPQRGRSGPPLRRRYHVNQAPAVVGERAPA